MKSFSGVLLKPLDQQGDRDGTHIDPAGVTFDPDQWIPIWRDFNYNVPDGWLGRGKVSRETDGSIIVTGELKDVPFDPERKEEPWKLAIGVIADKIERGAGAVTRGCRLMSIALTAEHVDPTQPPIVIGATITSRRAKHMNLVRLGHYHTPVGPDDAGFCQTALVVGVGPDADGVGYVNLVVWDKDGDNQKRLDVPVVSPLAEKASFHLSGECPWSR